MANHLSDDDLRKRLQEYGEDVGPVTHTTRSVYERRLRTLQTNSTPKRFTDNPLLAAFYRTIPDTIPININKTKPAKQRPVDESYWMPQFYEEPRHLLRPREEPAFDFGFLKTDELYGEERLFDRGVTHRHAVGSVVCNHKSRIDTLEFEWKIPDFFRKLESRPSVLSPEFSFSNCTWRLRLEMNSLRRTLLFRIQPETDVKPIVCNIAVRKSNGAVQKICDFPQGKLVTVYDAYYSNLRERRSEVAPSGTVTLIMEVNVPRPLEMASQSSQTWEVHDPSSEEMMSEPSEHMGTDRLVQDLKELLLTGDVSDATIRVKGQEFRVHRNILGARTPVFSAMFRHDTAERASGVVDIEDCEPDIFHMFLLYVYTGRVDVLTPQNATSLYGVADKYQVEELKKDCIRCIRRGLSVDSFCHAMSLALVHDERDLIRLGTSFFADHIQEILPTVEWMSFLCENPVQANELLIKAHGPPNKK